MAAAIYAYAFLFPGDRGHSPEPFDPRFRLACELYNRGLTVGLRSRDGDAVSVSSRSQALPFASLVIQSEAEDYEWAGYRLGELVSTADYAVRGLRNRYRQAGLGAPLAASLRASEASQGPRGLVPPGLRLNVTAFLEIEDPRAAILTDDLRGQLRLYAPEDATHVEIGERRVPIEFETTLPLALTLEHSRVWGFERQGLRQGNMSLLEEGLQLVMLRPYQRGKIPVVLVHGTGSSAGRWAQLINELQNDRRIDERFQLWLFSYNSDNPIALSGSLLREAITKAVTIVDPDGSDPSLRNMVVIGHSQGGLLTKLTAVESGNRFWENVSDIPLDELELKPETQELLEKALFIIPHPAVSRLVFIATPHRGSYLTRLKLMGWSPSAWVSSLIKLPTRVTRAITDVTSAVVLRDADSRVLMRLQSVPTSIDNMTPGNPFLQVLSSLPIAEGVHAHSIIAVKGDGPVEEGGDGVVKYESAHIDGVDSELVVRWGHSVQGRPEAIEEVRRILHLHAAEHPGR